MKIRKLKQILILSLALLLGSCTPKSSTQAGVYTGQVLKQQDVQSEFNYQFYNDKFTAYTYEAVDYDWLVNTYHEAYRKKLFSENVTKWETRANCSIFTDFYVTNLQLQYYRDKFHEWENAKRVAVGKFWYYPNPSDKSYAHAVIVAYTNRGWIFIESQALTGNNIIKLTKEQIDTRILLEL